jgi:hypothetical protein
MKIYGTKGEEILVSDEDYPLVSRHNWYVDSNGYARSSFGNVIVKLHKLIQSCQRGFIVDHINRNKLDNRRENLRAVNIQVSNQNRIRPNKHNVGFIGVKFNKHNNCYQCTVSHHSKSFWVGSSKDDESLAKLRDYVVWKLRGDYALLNFPDFDYSEFNHPKLEDVDIRLTEFKRQFNEHL